MRRRINGVAALVLAFVLMFFGVYNAYEWHRLKRVCTETTWGEVKSTQYHSGYSANVEFSVNDRTFQFETGKSIR